MVKINELIEENKEKFQSLSSSTATALEYLNKLTDSVASFKSRWSLITQKNQKIRADLQEQITQIQLVLSNYSQEYEDNFHEFQNHLSQVNLQSEMVMDHWKNRLFVIRESHLLLEQTVQEQVDLLKNHISFSTEQIDSFKEELLERQSVVQNGFDLLINIGKVLQKSLNDNQKQHDLSYQELVHQLNQNFNKYFENIDSLISQVNKENENLVSHVDNFKEDLEETIFHRQCTPLSEEIENQLNQLQENWGNVYKKLQASYEILDNSLSKIEKKLEDLDNSTDTIEQSLTESLQNLEF